MYNNNVYKNKLLLFTYFIVYIEHLPIPFLYTLDCIMLVNSLGAWGNLYIMLWQGVCYVISFKGLSQYNYLIVCTLVVKRMHL